MNSHSIVTVSAPGKIHLLGEHAVVYGHPALLAAINSRLYVKVQSAKVNELSGKEIKIISPEKDTLIGQAISVFKKAWSIKNLPPGVITVTSQIPVGSGLGSSAALAAATIGALMKFVKNLWNPHRINELAFEVEKLAHGNPSGADNTSVVFGGLVWYRREFDFLKSIWSLPISAYKIPRFFLIDSGRPKETTRQMVEKVAALYKRKKKIVEALFQDQEQQTKNLLLSLRTGDKGQLKKAIIKGENNLEKISVVGIFAQKIIRDIEAKKGAAKICGAGGVVAGSGMLLCYCKDTISLQSIAKKFKVSVSPISLGQEGIRIELANNNK